MAISRMVKFQLLCHDAVRSEIKRFLREAGVAHITDGSVENLTSRFDEESVRDIEQKIEKLSFSIDFLSQYVEKPSIFKRISTGPLKVSDESLAKILHEVDIDDIFSRCSSIERRLRKTRDDIARSVDLVNSLEPWQGIGTPFEKHCTDRYVVDYWLFPEKKFAPAVEETEGEFVDVVFDECCRVKEKVYVAVISPKDKREKVVEKLKFLGGYRYGFEGLKGTPSEIIKSERERQQELRASIEKIEEEANELTSSWNELLILYDHYNEEKALMEVERHLLNTEQTFLIEGWVRKKDAGRVENELYSKYKEVFITFGEPAGDEEPPIALENKPVFNPFEFVTTLYGYPNYKELDPTPLLAPFFVLFFAMCLTDAGYGLTLAAISGLAIMKFKPTGGMGKLLKVLFHGGIVTAVVGFITGGIFGIEIDSLPRWVRQFVVINPLEEPMKMLNIAFLIGLLHMLFGMGIRMYSNFKEHNWLDAVFDDLAWIFFLIVLAPLGYAGILGGHVPAGVSAVSKKAALVLAAVIFLTGGRKQGNVVKKFFKGIIGFYDVVGYFGDVLSYARLLALGLATSAIAIAINGIAKMVLGLPFYTGYVAALLVLVLGHVFNIAVNTLGAFVHSGRLQYLEFFSKFFSGGGKPFRPFRSERRYSVVDKGKV